MTFSFFFLESDFFQTTDKFLSIEPQERFTPQKVVPPVF